jgi:hypothetical protein
LRLDTHQDVARAIERLSRRDPNALAAFIVSFAQDAGPIGEQVRTFVVGDDIDQTTASLNERIESLGDATESDHRHARGREVGQRLEFILDAVETLVLPVDPKRAFKLLALVVESDGVAMENCGDHDYSVASAFERAAGLIGRAARSLPRAEVEATLKKLVAEDADGVRVPLGEVTSAFQRS